MLKRISLSIAISSLLFTSLALAQEAQDKETRANHFWKANLPGGNYMVALRTITSISIHQYTLDNSLIVDEVTIDTTGNSLVRFYSISPIGPGGEIDLTQDLLNRGKELLDEAGESTGISLNNMVVKQYPTTTHAKTIEFRLTTKENVQKLYQSIARSWDRGRGSKFTIE